MALNPEKILADISAGKFLPIYYLQGDEPYFIDKITSLIEDKALTPSERSFNQVVLFGKDASIGTIMNNARRYPMMSQRQVVIVREAQEIPQLNKDENLNMLEGYVKAPLASTILVLAFKNKSIDGRKAVVKTLDKAGYLVECKKIQDYKIADWISSHIASRGLQTNAEVNNLLAEYIGNDLARISNEIDKVSLNLGNSKQLTVDLVQKFVGISKEYNIWELQRALVARDTLKAYRIAAYFAGDPKKNPIFMGISALFGFFSKLLVAHTTPDKSDGNLVAALGINQFALKDYKAGLKSFNATKVVEIIKALKMADLKAKGLEGDIDEDQIWQELIFKILY